MKMIIKLLDEFKGEKRNENFLILVLIVVTPTTIALTASSEPKQKPILGPIAIPKSPKLPTAVPKETPKEKQERIDEICEQILEEGPPEKIARGLHVKLGKAAEWVANNANRPDGWSLTGYSSLKIKNGNMSRWRIGVINGELDWQLYEELENRKIPRYNLLEEWNRRKSREVIFGIFFTKEF